MAVKLINKSGSLSLTTPATGGGSAVREVWLGTKEQYTADKASGIINAQMLCFIVENGAEPTPTPTTGVIQNGSVLTILSDVVITQNNDDLTIGA